MIIESIVLGVASIVLGSLWFADRMLKREMGPRSENTPEEILPKSSGQTELKSFVLVREGTACRCCGLTRKLDGWGKHIQGMEIANICRDNTKCPAGHIPHLHAHCISCKDSWLMSTKDGK